MSQASIDEETKNAKQSAPPLSNYKPPQPSFWLLFSLFAKKDLFVLLLPAICAALAAASIPPFLTIVIGDAYDVFGAYQAVTNPTAEDHRLLLKGIGLASIEFCAISAGALVLSGVMSSLWIWVGEKNVMYIRRLVYDTVSSREMEWFDKNSSDDKAGGENVGAGGLMTQFASYVLFFVFLHKCSVADSFAFGMLVPQRTFELQVR
jgi:ATP-binding cassette subfamily B (MDR/TAP) protein 1